jgi:hypothetical protein
MSGARTELTLGPNLFNWAPETWRDFYFRIADEAPVAVVYLGETICSKRAPLFSDYYEAVSERLGAAGPQGGGRCSVQAIPAQLRHGAGCDRLSQRPRRDFGDRGGIGAP